MSPPFDSLALRQVSLELKGSIIGAQVQKIRQPDPFTVLIRFHGNGKSRWLLLCAQADLFRAHFTTRTFSNPQEPPVFCMALRKYLEGGRVTAVEQAGADRVLRIEVASTWGRLLLIADLMGRHSNLILVAEDGTILEAIKHVGSTMSRRVVLPGRQYAPLPPTGKPSLWDASDAELSSLWAAAPIPVTRAWLLDTFGGMSPALAATVLATADPKATLDTIVASVRSGATGESPSEALDAGYEAQASVSQRDSLLRQLNAKLDKEGTVLRRRLADLDAIEERGLRAEEWRIAGELLSANAHGIERGTVSVSLPNYYSPDLTPMVIALDPTLSARENAQAYFARSRKAKTTAERAPALRSEVGVRLAELEAIRSQAAQADESELLGLAGTGQGQPPAPASKSRRSESEYPSGVRIKRFTSDEGWQIWIGENATGNDYLTTRLSDPGDIWMHVRAAASAHGVIRTNKHPEKVPHATLRRAAELVAAKSEAKSSSVIAVDYTLRRYVRKPRGAAPGRVTYTNEKTIEVSGAED
ncbi:MAG TPA: NFACT RNA binding domain-containing protein [Armatimonadota bacterium]|jgi:predicted ribosome quality control (RQC) complex YloA/Tae2 family protein